MATDWQLITGCRQARVGDESVLMRGVWRTGSANNGHEDLQCSQPELRARAQVACEPGLVYGEWWDP